MMRKFAILFYDIATLRLRAGVFQPLFPGAPILP
jgi:hypothetical protein